MTGIQHLAQAADALGLALRGAFHPCPADAVPQDAQGRAAGTLVLLGFTGREGWPAFARSPERQDGRTDPLDRWSRRVITELASTVAALPLFPFDGPPWHPFGRWAQRGEGLGASPLGITIHPAWGLWHSYRGALAFEERLALAEAVPAKAPCETCVLKPCLSACPVGAFSREGFAASACRSYLGTPAGQVCMSDGCAARRACPVGRGHAYGSEQTVFLMRAFAGSPLASDD